MEISINKSTKERKLVDRRKIFLELSQPNSYFDFQTSKIRCKFKKRTTKNEKIRIKEEKGA